MSRPPPPPPPPHPEVRGGNPGMGQRPPQPPAGAQIPRPPPPPGMPIQQQLPIRQQSTRIQDITPPKMLDESACLKKLTTYSAYTIRKCPPRDPKKEGRGTWARSEITEERWPQEEILKQIKKLSERGRSAADKKKALMPNQQGQITTLFDNVASTEVDRAFEWSLVQLDSVTKPVSVFRGGKKRDAYETVSMLAFFKRSPRKDLNPIMLFQNIEKMKAESMRPPQQPPQTQQGGPEPIQIVKVEGGDHDKGHGPKPRSKSREKKYHERDDSSTGDSFDSDTDSHSSFTGSDSIGTSISSKSHGRRRHSHSKPPFHHSHSRPREHRKAYYLEQRAHSPELHYEAYGGSPRPYMVPDVPPRLIPAALPATDPVMAAYHAGRVDADAERFGTADRIIPRPVERPVIERVRPVPVISYGPMEHRMEPRYSVPNSYADDRYFDDLRRDDMLRRRQRDAEDYIIEGRLDGEPDGRRPSDFMDRREPFYERRPSEPLVWNNRHPFAPAQLRRRYPHDDSSSGW